MARYGRDRLGSGSPGGGKGCERDGSMASWRRRDRVAGGGPRVVVAGAGFAGLATLRGLARIGARTLLVDRNVYSTFQPLLYQVATGGLAPSDVAYPIRSLVRRYRARYRHGELAGVDPGARRVRLTDGTELEYDYLILATGVSAAYYGVAGAAEHTVGLYTRRDAIALRNDFNDRLEHLAAYGTAKDLTVTIVGGGATGVELAGTMAEVRNIALPALFPDTDFSGVHIRLVEMGGALLAPFRPSLQRYARRQLLERGVEVMLGTAISQVHPDHIVLASGEKLPSDLTVWAAGVAGPAADRGWGLPTGRGGRIVTGPDLRVDGQERIFAVGGTRRRRSPGWRRASRPSRSAITTRGSWPPSAAVPRWSSSRAASGSAASRPGWPGSACT